MTPKLGTFKYDHDDRIPMGWVNWLAGLLCLPLILAAFSVAAPLGFVAIVATLIFLAIRIPKKQIRLGTRYAIVGNTIVYFRNVRKMEFKAGHDLTLHWGTDRRLRIEQSRFPTGARKADKIAKNKAAKFEKVSGKIIDRVLFASPSVALTGIDRQAYLAEKAEKAASAAKTGKAGA